MGRLIALMALILLPMLPFFRFLLVEFRLLLRLLLDVRFLCLILAGSLLFVFAFFFQLPLQLVSGGLFWRTRDVENPVHGSGAASAPQDVFASDPDMVP